MAKNVYKRIVGSIISLALIISVLPMTVFAVGGTTGGIDIFAGGADKTLQEASMIRGRRASSNLDGTYKMYLGTLEHTGDYAWLYPVYLDPGEVLHAEIEIPFSADVDYDLYLYEANANGMTTGLVDYSEYTTYINGTSRTLEDAVGTVNNSTATKTYAIYIESRMGGSDEDMYLTVCTNTVYDAQEADENVKKLDGTDPIYLSGSKKTTINSRTHDTLMDNDWYKFEVPVDADYNRVRISCNEVPVEVYTRTTADEMQLVAISGGMLNVSAGIYYVKVGNYRSVSGNNYTLTFQPEFFIVKNIELGNYSGGDGNVNYNGEVRYRITDTATLTVPGIAYYDEAKTIRAVNASITVTIENDDWDSSDSVTVYTDSNGEFTAYVPVPQSVGKNWDWADSTIIHYYDKASVSVQSGTMKKKFGPDIFIFTRTEHLFY